MTLRNDNFKTLFLQKLHNINAFITSFIKFEIEQFYGK